MASARARRGFFFFLLVREENSKKPLSSWVQLYPLGHLNKETPSLAGLDCIVFKAVYISLPTIVPAFVPCLTLLHVIIYHFNVEELKKYMCQKILTSIFSC